MADYRHDDARLLALSEQQRRGGVAKIGEPLRSDARLREQLFEPTVNVPTIEGRADGGGEDEAAVLPARARDEPLLCLASAMSLERGSSRNESRAGSRTRWREIVSTTEADAAAPRGRQRRGGQGNTSFSDGIVLALGATEGGVSIAVELASDPASTYWSRVAAAGNGLPAGPVYSTPWGMVSAFSNDPVGYFQAAFRTFGDVVSFRAWPFTSFFLAHPDHIKHVLQENNQGYVKGVVIAKLKVLVGEGLFTSEGDFWRRQRRLAQPAFHRQRLAGFADAMTTTAARVLDRWMSRVRSGEPFDVSAQMSALTLGVVGQTLFGRSLDDETDQVSRALLDALEPMNERISRLVPSPLWWPSAANRRLRRAIAALDRVVFDIIETRRRTCEDAGDLLSMLMRARDVDTGETMTDRQLRDEVMTFLLAGHETTAMALSWTWYLLARHPEIEARLAREIGTALAGRTPTVDDLPRLAYARQVVEEAMRFYPPVWGFVRQAVRPDTIAGYRIPKGSVVNIIPAVTHRHPAFWKHPDRFDPEHFAPDAVRERPRFAYLPFSGGPRLCIGNEFALMEASLVVAMTLQRYRLRLTTERPTVEAEVQLTLRPKNGLPMRVVAA